MRGPICFGSIRSGHSPISPMTVARSVPWPTPVADSEPYRRTSTRRTCASRPRSRSAVANSAAARMGPTVCELEGPIPILNRSNTLMAMPVPRRRMGALWERSVGANSFAMQATGLPLPAGDCPDPASGKSVRFRPENARGHRHRPQNPCIALWIRCGWTSAAPMAGGSGKIDHKLTRRNEN
ncbi:hypothetical protein FQZ97_930370 [compost metagenome]